MDKSVAVCAILTGSSATPADARPPTCIGHFERDRRPQICFRRRLVA